MKKLVMSALFLCTAIGMLSCSSDDDSSSNVGVTINGEAFNGTVAILLKIETTENTYSFTITDPSDLTNVKTITIGVTFPLAMSVTGDYAHPTTEDRVFQEISFYSISNPATGSGTSSAMFNGTGTVTITDNGNENYTLVINMTMDDGVIVKGTFTDTFIGQ
jgi:hypothetical protein